MVVQNVGAGGKANIAFTVLRDELPKALTAVQTAATELGAEGVTHDDDVSKVSAVGLGMASQTGVADRMFRALAESNVNILAITTSQIKVSVLVKRTAALEALRAVHREFELEKRPAARSSFGEMALHAAAADPAAIVARLQAMEGLTIEAIQLDETQARITIDGVVDQPGVAASIFESIAAEEILVDMIVQSVGHDGKASVSFTVKQNALAAALEVVKRLAEQLKCGGISHDGRIAILSVTGIGMRSHTGVGIRMFQALADAGINVDMINTSEVRINAAVAAEKGEAALAALKKAFADVMG
jgi:aspartate kinase